MHLAAGDDSGAGGKDVLGVGARDRREADDARSRRVQAGDSHSVGLELADALGVEASQPGDLVGLPAALELLQAPRARRRRLATITFPHCS